MRSLIVALFLTGIVGFTSLAAAMPAPVVNDATLHSVSGSGCDLIETLCDCNIPPDLTVEPSPVAQIEACFS